MYRGSHSTTATRVQSIRRGFHKTPAKYVRKGTGVYFWAENRRYLQLAKAWYEERLERGDFDQDRDPRGVVVIAIVEATGDEYFDLDDERALDALDEFVERRNIDTHTTARVSEAIDLFVATTEEELGCQIVLCGTRVAPPKKWPRQLMWLRGAPLCYIVRDPERIRIETVVEVTDV